MPCDEVNDGRRLITSSRCFYVVVELAPPPYQPREVRFECDNQTGWSSDQCEYKESVYSRDRVLPSQTQS